MSRTPHISRFHYLTQDMYDISHQELAEIACKNGIDWVQLRVKNKSYDEWLQIARDVSEITSKYNAVLIINDNVEIAKAVNADGVHLGKDDLPVEEARQILGADKIIGGTANTVEDIVGLQNKGVDYIGLGPFRFTSTKEKLRPVLGLEGYFKLSVINQLSIPILAIGGIHIEDVQPLMQTRIHGIAVSSAINRSANKEQTIKEFLGHLSLTSK